MDDGAGARLLPLVIHLDVDDSLDDVYELLVRVLGRLILKALGDLAVAEREALALDPHGVASRGCGRVEGGEYRVIGVVQALDDDLRLGGVFFEIFGGAVLVHFVDFLDAGRLVRHHLIPVQTHDRPGAVLHVEVIHVAVLGGDHLVLGVRGHVNEGARRDDPPVLSDEGVDFPADGENHEFVGMVMDLGTRAGHLADLTEIHVFPLDDGSLAGGEMGRDGFFLDFFETVERHPINSFSDEIIPALVFGESRQGVAGNQKIIVVRFVEPKARMLPFPVASDNL